MKLDILSIDEIIQSLKRSSFPTVIVEGREDIVCYRKIEESLSDKGISIFPVGGKSRVLDLFGRRKDINRNDILFIVDLDKWSLSGTPKEFQHRKLITTEGYSIENDVINDGDIISIFTSNERKEFEEKLNSLVLWYSFCVDDTLNTNTTATLKDHPNQVLNGNNLCEDYKSKTRFLQPRECVVKLVRRDPLMLLRGKTLLNLIVAILSQKDRSTKYSKNAVLEFGASRFGEKLRNIKIKIEKNIFHQATL